MYYFGSVEGALSEGISPVVVDNTNTQFWEMRPYVIAVSQFIDSISFFFPSFNFKSHIFCYVQLFVFVNGSSL